MLELNLQLFGGRGGSSGKSAEAGIYNSYQSNYGLPNVGNMREVTTFAGSTLVGTVEPSVSNVQEYFNTGAFDNYGTNARAKQLVAKAIVDDMRQRGYDVSISEDKVKILPSGDTGKTITISNTKSGWKAKSSISSGSTSRGGMKGALDRASRR